MPLNDFANMRSKDVLKTLKLETPPFDPFEIASLMGVKVDTSLDWEKIRDIKDGHIYIKDDKPVIWINPLRPKNRQKFTLAHELGHLVYDVLPNMDTCDKLPSLQHYRNDNCGAKETRANKFAAGLLMPIFAIKDIVYDISDKKPKATLDDYIDAATSIFEVSRQAVIVRFKSLGIAPDDYTYGYIS